MNTDTVTALFYLRHACLRLPESNRIAPCNTIFDRTYQFLEPRYFKWLRILQPVTAESYKWTLECFHYIILHDDINCYPGMFMGLEMESFYKYNLGILLLPE